MLIHTMDPGSILARRIRITGALSTGSTVALAIIIINIVVVVVFGEGGDLESGNRFVQIEDAEIARGRESCGRPPFPRA